MIYAQVGDRSWAGNPGADRYHSGFLMVLPSWGPHGTAAEPKAALGEQDEGQSGQAGTLKGRCQGYRAGSKPSTPACRVQAKPRTPWRAMLLSTLVFPRAEDFSR